jgi:hypothetical protein
VAAVVFLLFALASWVLMLLRSHAATLPRPPLSRLLERPG